MKTTGTVSCVAALGLMALAIPGVLPQWGRGLWGGNTRDAVSVDGVKHDAPSTMTNNVVWIYQASSGKFICVPGGVVLGGPYVRLNDGMSTNQTILNGVLAGILNGNNRYITYLDSIWHGAPADNTKTSLSFDEGWLAWGGDHLIGWNALYLGVGPCGDEDPQPFRVYGAKVVTTNKVYCADTPNVSSQLVNKAYADLYKNSANHTNIERHVSFIIQDPTNNIPYWQPNPFGRLCQVKEGFAKCRYASATGVVSIIRQTRTDAWGTYVNMKTGLGMDTNGEVTTSFTPSVVSNDQQIGIILTYLKAYGVTQACEVELELVAQ